MLEFDVAWSHFDVAWGHFDVAWQKLWHKNDVFDEILGCAGHLKLPKKKWAPVAVKIFYKYAARNRIQARPIRRGGGKALPLRKERKTTFDLKLTKVDTV